MIRIDRPIFTHPPFTIHQRLLADDVGESLQWWLTDTQVNDFWVRTGGGEGIKIGIVDTGIDEEHRQSGDLTQVVADAKDFTGSRHGWRDQHGHGTHVAGIIAAGFGNRQGVAGLAHKAKLYCAKGLGDSGSGSDSEVSNAIFWCIEQGCHIINLSLGSPVPSQRIKNAVEDAHDSGVIVLAAAGNAGGEDNVGYPAKYDTCFAVGAIDRTKRIARFSDSGLEVDGVGYGVKMLSCYQNGEYAVLSGTSMATPHLAGFVANRMSAELKHTGSLKTSSLAKLINLFRATSQDLGDSGHDPEYGHGFPITDKLFSLGLEDGGDGDQPIDDGSGFQIGPFIIHSPSQPDGLLSVHMT